MRDTTLLASVIEAQQDFKYEKLFEEKGFSAWKCGNPNCFNRSFTITLTPNSILVLLSLKQILLKSGR